VTTLAESILERTFVYRLWQAPFAEQKFAPILQNNDLHSVRRVLDVACGPGTNTHHFAGSDYLGVDINERYIRNARQRHRRDFVAADVREYGIDSGEKFDFILINSFLHHLNDDEVRGILRSVCRLLTPDGHAHIMELVLPPKPSPARLLARWDRGDYARPLEQWRNLFDEFFETDMFYPYPLTGLGVTLWNMVYFKGRVRQ
jgi:SAM-dependent methyltransferase